jgi:hypothetical protein
MPDPRLATLLPEDHGRVYTHPITRERHVSTTTVLKTMSKELTRWAAKLAAGEAWDNRTWLLGVSRQQAVDAFGGAADRNRNERGDHGSFVHRGAELLALSAAGYTLDVKQQTELAALLTLQGDAVREGLYRFGEWASRYVAEWLYLEQTVWGNGWAGTFDAIVRLKDGRTALVDYKTGNAIYREPRLQLASYAFAPVILNAEGEETAMPWIDLCAVVHLPQSGGYSFLDLRVEPDDLEVFEHLLEVWQWTERVPRNPGVAIPLAQAPSVPAAQQCGDPRPSPTTGRAGSVACILERGHSGQHHGRSKTGSRNYYWGKEQDAPTAAATGEGQRSASTPQDVPGSTGEHRLHSQPVADTTPRLPEPDLDAGMGSPRSIPAPDVPAPPSLGEDVGSQPTPPVDGSRAPAPAPVQVGEGTPAPVAHLDRLFQEPRSS